ncbi:glycosyltransferase family 2 protein [Aliihoeflea sp. PC F10.4]
MDDEKTVRLSPGAGTVSLNDEATRSPRVSVIMANYSAARHLPEAIGSVLSQTVGDLELIISDDASPDDSVDIIRAHCALDPRVRLLTTERNFGPGAARNRALAAATGEWIAIVDSDDIIHPERLERMIAAAEATGVDAVADDLLHFSDEDGVTTTLLAPFGKAVPASVSTELFIRSNTSGANIPPLGYLKPLFRRASIAHLAYDETVRIGEDYDFLLRFLLNGGKLGLFSEPLYLYRRHAQSISHRLSQSTVAAMIANQERLLASREGALPDELRVLFERRLDALKAGLAFEELVDALKGRRLGKAASLTARRPALLFPLMRSVRENFERRIGPAKQKTGGTSSAIIHETGKVPTADMKALLEAVDVDESADMIAVPRPGAAGDWLGGSNWVQLAQPLSLGRARIVAWGMAGIYAAKLMPGTRLCAAVIDELDDLERACALTPDTVPILIANVAQARFAAIASEPFCDGFSRILPEKQLLDRTKRACHE